mgnify:FL=1
MKKYLNILLAFVMVFALTGCGKKEEVKTRTPLEVLVDVAKNDVKKVKVDTSLTTKVNMDGMSIDGTFNLNVATEKLENDKYKAVIELGENPILGKQKLYLDGTYFYVSSNIMNSIMGMENTDEYWIKSEVDSTISDEEKNLKDIDLKTILTDKDFYLLSRTGDVGVYRLVISEDLVKRAYKAINNTDLEDENTLKTNVNVDITIDEKNNRITKVSSDLTESISTIDLGEEINLKEMVEKLSFEINITYDNFDVVIPDEVVKNALTQEEYDEKMNTME